MNERIKVLAYEAKLDEHMLWTSDEGNKLPDDMIKFAELIVQECCDQVRMVDAMEIKRHFGVEE